MVAALSVKRESSISILERSRVKTCKKCGGKLARDYEDIACINCGALHDEAGNLLKNRFSNFEN
ncbi:MAG: hypothetical protein WC370_07720 [Dehalococcoidales bacterium]|jgi:Zn finger protein HypA/HybF involved in hydrogenase expression